MPAKFVLIGSGLAGGLLAAYLGRRGYDVDLYKCINSIGRAALNTTVIEAAQLYPNVRVYFNHKCTDVDLDSATAHLETSPVAAGVSPANSENQIISAHGDAVIGVDGAFSAVRQSMQMQISGFEYDESYLAHGYEELTIPPGPDGSWPMEKNALHIWPRKSFMMIALPNPDGSFTCTLFWEFEGARSFATTKTDADIRRFFDEEFPDAVPLMPSLLEDFRGNPTGSLVTIRCAPWYYRDKVCLLGDAAHAVVPFYGQGMNAAFEDCVVLDECLEKFPDNRERAFAEYFSRRKENADALADLAIGNFIEMRDKTTSRTFRAKKKIDHALEALLPGIYLPLYTMVTFTRIPYAEAARRARLQDRIVYGGFISLPILLIALLLYRSIAH